ncbi:MAG: GGDEF domain-containing protein [Candidatus Omnitrophica bacterium]|nr:GGDEF domain-containing protein [Candidatus Omnitrophota bacterium]
MIQIISILTFFYVIGVIIYIKKLLNTIKQENYKKIEDMRWIFDQQLDQQKKQTFNQSKVENEAFKIFTLYDMTKEITKSLSQQEAFEIFKKNLQKHARFHSCELITSTEELKKYKGDKTKDTFRLKSKSTQMGHIVIDNLNPEDQEKASILIHQFALALRRVKLYEEIERTAITDSLTDIYRRRYAIQRLDEEIDRSKVRSTNLSCLMIDIDRFKECNDKYGHLVGDQVLREMAQIIKSNIREIDIPGRFGGEEFCIILPDTDAKGAKYVAERIRTACQEKMVKAYDADVSFTISVGVATFPTDARKRDELIDKADWFLYKAKKQGRNRVCAFGN